MNTSKSNLLVVGSVAYDSIKTPFGKINKALGGSGSYFSLAASYFTKPSLVAVVGDDFALSDQKTLGQHADIQGLQKAKGKTFAWGGKYSFDLNSRQTLFTKLGVFENFKPSLSPEHKTAEYIFLGNIHPVLQKEILSQTKNPKLVGLDTMNYWIQSAPKQLAQVLKLVNILIINDSEARQLSGGHNLLKAAANISKAMKKSSLLIIKRGEYGLLMFSGQNIFNLPGYPLEDVVDPTGAGDSFAGGFMGYLAKSNNTSWNNLKKACVAGSTMASFCVEKMGTKGLLRISKNSLNRRMLGFKHLTKF
jgi:sugar/nucleoside kinase (ribokinase family)